MCSYCMPCPYGVDIPAVLTFADNIAGKGNLNWRNILGDYKKKVPYLRGANHCIGCGACVSQCPQSINIPEEMRRIDEFTELLKVKEISS
ncbi:MAG: 4Fe-4S dicluster domain-containing protein [Kiritimatiellae bacterium]|nr:4Fe-4S dicluster domain-containing protein [Kiritimatiellia bacterium]